MPRTSDDQIRQILICQIKPNFLDVKFQIELKKKLLLPAAVSIEEDSDSLPWRTMMLYSCLSLSLSLEMLMTFIEPLISLHIEKRNRFFS